MLSNKKYEDFYKKNKNDRIWWTSELDENNESLLDSHLFSFDKKKVYDLFKDYPNRLTNEEQEIFDKENPFWVKFFSEK